VELELKMESRLSAYVALTVVIISVFMAMCKLKDENLVDAMIHSDMKTVDTWGEYQAQRIKLHDDENDVEALKLHAPATGVAAQAATAEIARLNVKAIGYQKSSAELKKEAGGYEAIYAKKETTHAEFDVVDAFCAIALALAAVAALADYVLLLYIAWGAAAVAGIIGVSALLGIDLIAGILG
jgi:Domain of unknown function (DUF4337)